jgi:isoamylase
VPMLLGGDEISRTQQGNNNPYCQDNKITWYNWDQADNDLYDYCKKLIAYRRDHPAFHRRGWFQGIPIYNTEVRDIAWFNLDGKQMSEQNWGEPYGRSLGLFLNGKTIPNPNLRREPVFDDNFYIIFNAHDGPLNFTLPSNIWGETWLKELDTHIGWPEKVESYKASDQIKVEPRSIVVLRNES